MPPCTKAGTGAKPAGYLRQNDVLGVGLALLGDGVHEGLGGEARCLGSRQALSHAVHINIFCKSFLQAIIASVKPAVHVA